ncbi:MAG: hypothetical protein DCF22_00835 [Leptolyngbya sp.]|nr:MAG: hypothetical protein DCF22_00835 [Leptolyngbya sp.]
MKIASAGALILSLLATIATFPAQAQEEHFKYTCANGKTFEVMVRPDKAKLKLDGTTALKLLPLDAREGLKFAAHGTLLTMVNREASIEINDNFVYNRCVVQ